MVPLSTVCLALGLTAAVASQAPPVYRLEGGASGFVTEKDYIENKIARGVYSVFGNAAEEAREAGKQIKSAAKSAEKSIKEGADKAGNKAHSFWQSAEEEVSKVDRPKISWNDRQAKIEWEEREGAREKRNAVVKFFANPNNAFIAQGVCALIVGGLHVFSYDQYVAKWAGPVYKIFNQEVGTVSVVRSHATVLGAFLIGVFASDVMAYKSTSAGFKRGKIYHELASNAAILLFGGLHLASSEDPTDILPHVLGGVLFSIWFGFLSNDY